MHRKTYWPKFFSEHTTWDERAHQQKQNYQHEPEHANIQPDSSSVHLCIQKFFFHPLYSILVFIAEILCKWKYSSYCACTKIESATAAAAVTSLPKDKFTLLILVVVSIISLWFCCCRVFSFLRSASCNFCNCYSLSCSHF